MATFNLIFEESSKDRFHALLCFSSSQIFGYLLDMATLLWLYATERKCCDELAMHSSPTMALCNRALEWENKCIPEIVFDFNLLNPGW